MAFDSTLAARIRKRLGKDARLTEKEMFGGLAFLLNGNMCCGVHGKEMIVRLDPADTDRALRSPGARPFAMTGRPMRGWILVGPAGVKSAAALGKWIRAGLDYAGSLPPK
jgi:hypothetical protein